MLCDLIHPRYLENKIHKKDWSFTGGDNILKRVDSREWFLIDDKV
jgi:hypothetical protein